MGDVEHVGLAELVAAARRLAERGGRAILGIAGAPGAGKSVLSDALVEALGGDAVLLGMDAFHLADSELERLGRADRKGAPDTFDVDGYCSTLQRVLAADRPVYAPVFDRSLEAAIAGSVRIDPEVPLVITEGNYLLLDAAYEQGDWAAVRPLLTETWFVQPDEAQRLAWLVARHERYGRSPEEAREWSYGTDQRNAAVVAASAALADRVLSVRYDG
ncbi:nucleoside/nucleotide kinase family protein [Leucobacter sp. CSA1]|uniref:Nucleoside/nucleotide kinase family protein n=1 Tax=Leucobacter chromiisoli TaxID=2796471 RepID=A0A934Q501_9MICO|nr:nucleoside/nucleotide kinase family protein [Leucobacter chromiisoli]MBK0417535.1 nucleoside/nucleotide kinase family protein [Leucobacter chromiisoli]